MRAFAAPALLLFSIPAAADAATLRTPFPVFYSPSTPDRASRLAAWLSAAAGDWCHALLPPVFPQDFAVTWSPTADSPVRMANSTTGESLFIVRPPFGRLGKQMETVLRLGRSPRNIESSFSAAHKVANAAFHLRAQQCFAARCHPCVASPDVLWAAVFEDDVAFVPGYSPGAARDFPRLLAAAAATAAADGANKLQLAVGNAGQEVDLDYSPKKYCEPHVRNVTGWDTARLRVCHHFSDSHAFAVSHAHASAVVAAHAALVARDGRGAGACLNPWHASTCGDDPGVLRDFFEQCDRPKRRRPTSDTRLSCRGLVLSGLRVPWALLHNNTVGFKMAGAHKQDSYGIIARMVKETAVWKQILEEGHATLHRGHAFNATRADEKGRVRRAKRREAQRAGKLTSLAKGIRAGR